MFPKPLPKALEKRQEKREAVRDDRNIKAAIKARDHYACRCCGAKKGLDVHERKTRGSGGVVSRANSLTLCRPCHQLAHGGFIQIEGRSCDDALLFTMSQRIANAVFPYGRIPLRVHVTPAI
jgi:hypothetical protein